MSMKVSGDSEPWMNTARTLWGSSPSSRSSGKMSRVSAEGKTASRAASDGGAVVGMVHVHGAVVAHGRVAAHHRVGTVAADDPRQLPPQRERGLEHAVLVAEEDHLGDAEHAAGLPLLLLPDRHERLPRHAGGRVLVGAGPAAGDADGDDVAAGPRPLRQRAAHGELLVVRMRVDGEHPGRCGRLAGRPVSPVTHALRDAGGGCVFLWLGRHHGLPRLLSIGCQGVAVPGSRRTPARGSAAAP